MPILKERYEVIVIGAGIGGLAAASVLVREGLDVLVLERAALPGGCCSSFRVGEFTFDAAASILQGFGEIGYHVQRLLFDYLGQQVDLISRDSAYTMRFGDAEVDFHRDRHTYTAELGALFPQQAGSILSFMRELEDVYDAFLDYGGPPRPRSEDSTLQRTGLVARHSMSAMRLGKYARTSAQKLLEKHLEDAAVMSFFDADLTFTTGYRLADVSAVQAALAIIDRHVGGTYHAIGSAQQIPNRLEKSVIGGGGRIAYRVQVERVLIEEGRAAGVRLADGRPIAADAIIANSSTRDLLSGLIPPDCASPQSVEWLDSLKPVDSVFALYLGVPEECVPAGLSPNTVVIDDPERAPHRFISVGVPSLLDPNLSPEGYHSVSIHAAVDPAAWPSSTDPEYGTEEYEEEKREQAGHIFERLLPLAPELGSGPVVWRLASPATFERYLHRERGALAAPFPPGAFAPGGLPGAVSEVQGLFLSGDSTFYGRGVAQAAGSGINAATAAMRYLSLKPPRFHQVKESFVIETVPVRPQISGQAVVDSISAVLESHRCLRCEDSPCARACPASIDIPNVIRRIGGNDVAGAAKLIREANPLGEVCGTVCPAASLCEAACRRAEIDAPVMIGQLEAFVCGVAQGPEGWPEPFRGRRRERIAVIGSGPAGISCAFYLSQMGFNVEIFEESVEAGGLPAHAMTASRLGRQILEREMEGAMAAGIDFRGNTVFGEDVNFESLLRDGFRAVFLGTGLKSVKMPSVRGIDMPGVIDALSFLGAARRKVKRELGAEVAVIGESNLAIDTAMLAKELGADRVYLVTDRPIAAAGGSPRRFAEAVDAGIVLVTERKVVEVLGEGRVEGLRTLIRRIGSGPADGEDLPAVLDVGTVIAAWDLEGDPTLSGYLAGHLELGESGLIEVNEHMMTTRHGVFAGGDAVNGGGLVVRACADGRAAALGIARYLGSGPGAQAHPSSTPGEAGTASPGGESFFDRDSAS